MRVAGEVRSDGGLRLCEVNPHRRHVRLSKDGRGHRGGRARRQDHRAHPDGVALRGGGQSRRDRDPAVAALTAFFHHRRHFIDRHRIVPGRVRPQMARDGGAGGDDMGAIDWRRHRSKSEGVEGVIDAGGRLRIDGVGERLPCADSRDLGRRRLLRLGRRRVAPEAA